MCAWRKLIWAVVVVAVAISICIPGYAATGEKPLTVEDFRSLRKAITGSPNAETKALLDRINAQLETSEAVLIEFLQEELKMPPLPTSAEGAREYERFCRKVVEAVGRSSNPQVVPLLVSGIIEPAGSERGFRFSCGKALIAISDRVSVEEKDLRLLLEGQDIDLANYGRSILKIIRYASPDLRQEDLQRLLDVYGPGKPGRARFMVGSGDFESLAGGKSAYVKAMGIDGDRGKALRALIDDCRARCERYSAMKPGETGLDAEDSRLLWACQEEILLAALGELVKTEGIGAFDFLIGLMAQTESQTLRYRAAYDLYELTGQHFPLAAPLVYRNRSSGSADLTPKAVKAWRAWKSEAGKQAIEPSGRAGIAKEQRLSDFRMQSRGDRARGAESERPTDEIIDELLKEDDRQLLDMLSQVMARKTLSESQVQRIVDVAEKETSQPKRLILWRILYESQSAAGNRLLEKVLLTQADEAAVLGLVESLQSVRSGQVPLLTKLYAQTESVLVRRAIVRLATRRDDPSSRRGEEEAPKDSLIEWIARHARDEDDKLQALTAAYGRPGVNLWGRQVIRESLLADDSPRMRKALYTLVMRHSPDEYMHTLLARERDEEVQLAGLSELLRHLQDRAMRSTPENEAIIQSLRRAADSGLPPRVQQAVSETLDYCRKQAIADVFEGQGRLRMFSQASLGNIPEEQLRSAVQSLQSEMATDVQIERLKERFGELPEELQVRARLEEIRKERLGAARKLLGAAETRPSSAPGQESQRHDAARRGDD